MTSRKSSAKISTPPTDPDAMRDLLGYLNFSQGTISGRFRSLLNELFRNRTVCSTPETLKDYLLRELAELSRSGVAACADPQQAEWVIRFTLERLLSGYQQHHSDLLGHLRPEDFFSPLLLARFFEATLAAVAECGFETEGCLEEALRRLNHFVGYRPVAVLENDRRSEVYPHEKFCPLPVYFQETGAAAGPYELLIQATIEFMKQLPEDLLASSHFSVSRLSELCVDVRAHDHLHPANKRTNYVFGEWDPDEIDTRGYYRRFVIRRLILDSLIDWMNEKDPGSMKRDNPDAAVTVRKKRSRQPDAERLFDASAVLAGTILMASAISGSGPQTYDSSVSLTTLLPVVARQRDEFYQRLLDTASGERARRLRRLAKQSRQPFGHVRHELNMYLAKYGADQVQHRHLSWMFARMGFEAASCEEAAVIPCLSARFESEIQSRLVMIPRIVRAGELDSARRMLTEVIDLLHRGIGCGALVDPWNILGFQGLFPLFFAREDSIPDARVEILLEVMGQIFNVCGLTMSEAAATGRKDIHDSVLADFRSLAEEWDRYATTTVHDLTPVEGMKSVEAAEKVARVLARWRTAGESAGDISFWRQHVEDFSATTSFGQVVAALLDRNDHVAAMGLLMQWLSQADVVPLENGPYTMHRILHRLVIGICELPEPERRWQNLRRLFAFMEANAGVFWEIPTLGEFVQKQNPGRQKHESNDLDIEHLFDSDDADGNLFEAAWDDVTYHDSTDDGNASDMMEGGATPGTTEFEILYRQIEPRLKFLHTVGSIWSLAAIRVARSRAEVPLPAEWHDHLKDWLAAIRSRLHGFSELVREVRDYEITNAGSGLEGNIEYDVQMQCRYLLMQNALSTTVEFLMAERLISAAVSEESHAGETSSLDRQISGMFSALFAQDADAARRCFPAFCRELKRRPLLYVPFESGGQPSAILKARMLQAVIRVLLGQMPRLGLLSETYELLQVALTMERTSRPSGQAVTEFDRLFRIGLSSTVEAILQSAARWKSDEANRVRNIVKRVQRLLDSYSDLWTRHSGSMRLSVVEDLHDDDYAERVRDFIETYGEDLFHTRMLTLGNARAILHHGAGQLFEELSETVGRIQEVKILEDLEQDVIDEDDAVELAEFVYECVVDNFDRFLEYNTTTTHSDYGNRLFCLLDFLRLESLYDRFEWNTVPWQVAHETMARCGDRELTAAVEDFVREESQEIADSFVQELQRLEKEYGVRLPGLHDHINERIVGTLDQNRMAALVSQACPGASGLTEDEVNSNFRLLRKEISDFMSSRIGSGIEPPEWMQRLAGELDRVQDVRSGQLSEKIIDGEFRKLTLRAVDQQISEISRRNDEADSGM